MSRYIDADALKKRMLDYFSPPEAFDVADLRPSWAIQDGIEDIFATFPTADVAPVVHGEWISWYVEVKHGNCEEYIPHTACCACGTEIDPYHKDAYKWCPFCGARMDGEHGKKN